MKEFNVSNIQKVHIRNGIMHTNIFSHPGSGHMICEDYILTDPVMIGVTEKQIKTSLGQSHIIICDGCTQALYTEIGAQLIAFSAQKILKDYKQMNVNEFGAHVIRNADIMRQLVGLPRSCLNATLLVAFQDDDKIKINIWGDGVILLVNKDGRSSFVQVDYFDAGNAPYYLSYKLDRGGSRTARYLKEKVKIDGVTISPIPEHLLNVKTVQEVLVDDEDWTNNLYSEPIGCHVLYPSVFEYDIESYQAIGIASDGVCSFMNKKDRESIPLGKVMFDIMDFRNSKGKFVERRMNAFMKECEKDGIYHYDDFTLGVFNLK